MGNLWKAYSLRITWTLLFYFGLLAGVTAQTITGVNPNSGTSGQTVNMVITGSGTNFSSVTAAFIYSGGTFYQSSSFTPNSNTNLSATFILPPNALPGSYNLQIYQDRLQNGFTILPSAGGNYGYLSGKVVMDTNQNCIQDGGDLPVGNKIIKILPGPYYTSTDPSTGEFGLWVPLGSYTVSTPIPYGQGLQCPATGSYSVNLVNSLDSEDSLDFFLYYLPPPPPFNNLKVYGYAWPFRPGFPSTVFFKVRNTGNRIMSGYSLIGEVPSELNHSAEVPSADYVTGNTAMSWNLPDMNPGDVVTLKSYDIVQTTVPIGTYLPLTARLFPSDDYILDNLWTGGRLVTGSYDPNDKQVWNDAGENGDGFISPSDTLLHYLIRCQNTGNDTAFNIFIRDTLDPILDVASLQVIEASHPYEMFVSGSGFVEFIFPNILLVDSVTNEPESHAYIEYTIERPAGLPIGTQIDNTAHIYFDFNQPVVTNTVSSVICPKVTAAYTGNIANLTATFANSSSGTIGQYLWDFGDGNTSTLLDPVHSYAIQGYYTVSLRVTSTCGRMDSTSQPLTIGCPPPITDFIFTGDLSGMDFVDVSVGVPVSWMWDFGDGNTSTVQNPQHIYSSVGTYDVCLVATNNCGPETICFPVKVVLDIPKTDLSSIEIFPNPNSGQFRLWLAEIDSANVRLSMFDQFGHMVSDNNIGTVNGDYSKDFDMSRLSVGIYYLRIQINEETVTKKILKR